MASLVYGHFWDKLVKGNIDMDTDTFKVMLVNTTYDAIADNTKKDSHDFRDDVTSNEISGTGYTTGGNTVTVTVTKDDTNDREDLVFAATTWTTATITAYGAVYYKSRGGAASADELCCYNSFGGAVTSTAGTFSLGATTIRIQN